MYLVHVSFGWDYGLDAELLSSPPQTPILAISAVSNVFALHVSTSLARGQLAFFEPISQ